VARRTQSFWGGKERRNAQRSRAPTNTGLRVPAFWGLVAAAFSRFAHYRNRPNCCLFCTEFICLRGHVSGRKRQTSWCVLRSPKRSLWGTFGAWRGTRCTPGARRRTKSERAREERARPRHLRPQRWRECPLVPGKIGTYSLHGSTVLLRTRPRHLRFPLVIWSPQDP